MFRRVSQESGVKKEIVSMNVRTDQKSAAADQFVCECVVAGNVEDERQSEFVEKMVHPGGLEPPAF